MLAQHHNAICCCDAAWKQQRMICLQPLGAVDLAEGLVNNVSLHSLNLAWNGLENVGCTAIAQSLHKNMGLQVCTSSFHCHAETATYAWQGLHLLISALQEHRRAGLCMLFSTP